MKIAVTTEGNTLDSAIDKRFGRSKKFIVYNTETKEFVVKDNTQNLNAMQGAGIQTGQNVVETGAEAVITNNCGPKAFTVLSQAGVSVYNTDAETVQEALDMFKEGELKKADAANVGGHWV